MLRKSKPAAACSTPESLRSNSVPRTHDPVTRTLKYVDPGHRFCVPNFAAASFNPKDKHSKYHNLCHSSCGVIRMTSGDLYAIPHPQVLTGYKAKNASGQSNFSDVTSKAYFENTMIKVGELSGKQKKLCPYHLWAPRNQARHIVENNLGLSTFDCRNASYIRLVSGRPCDMKTPMSTNQRYMKLIRKTPGMSNASLFADRSKKHHRFQTGIDE